MYKDSPNGWLRAYLFKNNNTARLYYRNVMTPDEKHEFYHKAFNAGKEHSGPSPLTLKFMEETRLVNQETRQEMKYIKEKLDKMPTREEMLLSNEKLVERIFLKANEKYAPRLVEKIVYGMVGVIILYVLNQWLSLV